MKQDLEKLIEAYKISKKSVKLYHSLIEINPTLENHLLSSRKILLQLIKRRLKHMKIDLHIEQLIADIKYEL
jgi:hypothetical protein